MVSTSDYQLGVGQGVVHNPKRFDHQFEPFIGSPFSEREDTVLGIAAPRKVGVLGPSSEDAVRTEMDVVTAVFVVQDFAIPGHQHRHGIREEQHTGSERSSRAINTRVAHARIF